jgi:BlaI family transcriptional regulator, penicillinase repressor
MAKTNDPPRPTDAELDILNVLWDEGPATVRQVHERLQARKTSRYTTTLKLMQIMAEKGLVDRDETARSHVYRVRQAREHVQRRAAKHLLDRFFGGSARSLLVGALDAKPASEQELAELKKLLADYEKDNKRRSKR